MAQMPLGNPMKGVTGIFPFAGTPSTGTNAVQTITIGGTPAGGDTFKLTFGTGGSAQTTAAIAWNSTNATLVSNIDTALEALSSIGTGGVTTAVGTMTAGVGTITCTFTTLNAGNVLPTMVASAVVTTGSMTVSVATTTPGVASTFRGIPKAAVVNDTTHAVLYQNQGTNTAPTFTKVSGT